MVDYDEQQATEDAYRFLKSNSTASLQFGENIYDVSYTFAPDGRLVISAMVAMLQPCDIVMFVPEYSDNCMELHVSLVQFKEDNENGAIADKWQVYHGEPPDVQWAFVDIDAARFHEMFVDGEGLCRENAIAVQEQSICKTLNALKETVRMVCFKHTKVDVVDPFVVGVDPLGIDIRAPFGIVRIPAPSQFITNTDVLRMFGVEG
ncbi:MAG: hypothetical protein HOC27_06445 [Phycisphaerae bacterium]|jgi:hypothetical protein|nr:hypothetical protein [Phycisphaerae bacterium]